MQHEIYADDPYTLPSYIINTAVQQQKDNLAYYINYLEYMGGLYGMLVVHKPAEEEEERRSHLSSSSAICM